MTRRSWPSRRRTGVCRRVLRPERSGFHDTKRIHLRRCGATQAKKCKTRHISTIVVLYWRRDCIGDIRHFGPYGVRNDDSGQNYTAGPNEPPGRSTETTGIGRGRSGLPRRNRGRRCASHGRSSCRPCSGYGKKVRRRRQACVSQRIPRPSKSGQRGVTERSR